MPDPHKTAKGTRPRRHAAALGTAMSLLAACAGDSMPETGTRTPIPVSGAAETDVTTGAVISTPSSHQTSSTAGHYLAARQALYFNDVIQSADFFLETLETDADSVPILQRPFSHNITTAISNAPPRSDASLKADVRAAWWRAGNGARHQER